MGHRRQRGAASVGAIVRRILLRTGFDVDIPIADSAGPISAALAATAMAVLILFLARAWPPATSAAAAMAAGLAVYIIWLKYWKFRTGQHLGLTHLQLD